MKSGNLSRTLLVATALLLNIALAYAAIDQFLPRYDAFRRNLAADRLEQALRDRRPIPDPFAGEHTQILVQRPDVSHGSFWILWSALTLLGAMALWRRHELHFWLAYACNAALLLLVFLGAFDPSAREALLLVGRLFSV